MRNTELMSLKSRISCLFAALLLAGCSETSFMDTLGIGKASPDETQVTTNQPLSVPPDMQLRPPSSAGQPARAAAAPSRYDPGSLADPRNQPSAPARTASASQTAPAAPSANVDAQGRPISSIDKVYIKHGIDVYNPDGTHKKTVDLNRELAERIKAEKKAKNPKYGTIFNMGNLFKD